MYIPDGNPIDCTYSEEYDPDKSYSAVGWLEGVPIPTGDVPASLVSTLVRLARSHRASQARGYHACKYCPEEDLQYPIVIQGPDGRPLNLGSADIWVPGDGNKVFVAPDLIIHYIKEHGYKPPQDFIEAVMRLESAGY